MIKVKRDLIQKVICTGSVMTRRYLYFCPGRVDFQPLDPEPVCYAVARIKNDDGFTEVVGLYNSDGVRL